MGATPDGRDLAGMLSALLGWGVLVNAGGVEWSGGAPSVEMSVFGGRIITTSTFTDEHGIITLRPNSVAAEPAGAAGEVESVTVSRSPALPLVAIRERTSETSSEVPVEEASVIVAGGRGIGGPEGLSLVQELAHALGGAVGATRPAVDSGWIPYGQQIGQTGKTVKPKLYVALGISGATQHIVGILGAETILSINRDREAPITELSDLAIIGDLFQVGPAILHALRARTS
jgi:electron transfer flavoprotein alpha subunit